jgi:hypothetical protein
MQDKNILSYMSPNEQSPRRTHSVLGWISLACPVLLLGSCLAPFGVMSERSGIPTFAGLVILGIIVSIAALIDASRHTRRRAIPKATLFFYLAILWFVEVMLTM